MRPAMRRPRRARRSRWTTLAPTIAITHRSRRRHHQQDRRSTISGTISGTARPRPASTVDVVRSRRQQRHHARSATATVVSGAWPGRRSVRRMSGQRQPQHQGPGYRCGRQHRRQRAGDLHAGDGRADDRDHEPRSPGTTSSTRPRRRRASPSAARLRPAAAVRQSMARPRRSRLSTAPTPSRTPIRRR